MSPVGSEPSEDPGPPVVLVFEGRRYRVPANVSVAGALARLGVWNLSHSLKYHRPQGAACMSGTCAQCAMRIDGLPNRLACRTPVHDGITVERQNVLLSPRLDPIYLAYSYLGFRFDHHHFMARPRLLNALFTRVARRLSGLGKLPESSVPAPRVPHRREDIDALVVGAGPSGLAAVRRLSADGRSVVWIDEWSEPGGRLRGLPDVVLRRHDLPASDDFLSATRLPGVRWMPESCAVGWFEDEGFVIRAPQEMLSVRAKTAMLCTGASDLLPAFPGGLLPGVLTPRGTQRLLLEEGYRPRGMIVLAGGGARLALLQEALLARGDRVLATDHVFAARGYRRLATAQITYEGRRTWVDMREGVLVVEAGASPALELFQQAGGEVAYEPGLGVFVPKSLNIVAPDGCAVWVDGLTLSGSVMRDLGMMSSLLELVRANPAREVPLPTGPQDIAMAVAAGRPPVNPRAIVCACEDVTAADLAAAIQRGHADMELLKRYTGLSTGPCQGKSCLCHGARILSASHPDAVRATRFRPPVRPVSLAEAAGEPAP